MTGCLSLSLSLSCLNACFANCTDNEFCPAFDIVDLTFSVNMADQETNPAGVYLAGGSFGGNPGYLMGDPDGDDVWTITLPATIDANITYKFANQLS